MLRLLLRDGFGACGSWARGIVPLAGHTARLVTTAPDIHSCRIDLPEGRLATSTVCYAPDASPGAAAAALGEAWQALTTRLGPRHSQRATVIVLLTSAPGDEAARCAALLSHFVTAMHSAAVAAASEAAGTPEAAAAAAAPAVIGCTARRRQPDAAAQAPDAAGSRGTAASAAAERAHITLAAASLPGMAALAFHTATDSLPSLPVPFKSLLDAQPHLLLLTHPTDEVRGDQCSTLLQRFDQLMPGAALVGALASTPPVAGHGAHGRQAELPAEQLQARHMQQQQQHQQQQQEQQEEVQALLSQPRRGGRTRLSKLRSRAQPAAPSRSTVLSAPTDAVPLRRRGALRSALGTDSEEEELEVDDAATAAAASSACLFLGAQVHARGSVGLLLVPHAPARRLSPTSAAALVRLLLGGDLLGVCAHYGTYGAYLLPQPDVLACLQPTLADVVAYAPPQQREPAAWRPALPLLPGLEAGSGAAAGASADVGDAGGAEEVAMFALDGLQRSGRVWPGMQLSLRVFERRYQLMIKACLEHTSRRGGDNGGSSVEAARGGVAAGGMFGIVSGGYGTSATVLACRVSDEPHSAIIAATGRRFRCLPRASRVLLASFGLTLARVQWLDDALPAPGTQRAAQLAAAAREFVGLLAAAAQQQRQHADAATRFGGSLLFQSWGSKPAALARVDSTTAGAGVLPQEELWPRASLPASNAHTRLLGAWPHSDRQTLLRASELSLVVARCMPVDGAQQEAWFRSTDPVLRLRQQVDVLRQSPQACQEAVSVLGQLHPQHPLSELASLLLGPPADLVVRQR